MLPKHVRPVCLGDNRIRDTDQETDKGTCQDRMDWQRYVGREKSDGEPAKECPRQSCGLVGKRHREHEQDIKDPGSEP